MPTHERIIDHFVVLVSKEQQKQIIERLDASGFPDGDLVMEENFDLQAYLAPIGGGGFLELPCSGERPGALIRWTDSSTWRRHREP